jgi:hypothetical protein
MTGLAAKTSLARGREKRTKVRPVRIAVKASPQMISTDANQMAVQCRRIHVAVPDGCQRLDAEEEDVHKAIRSSMLHRSRSQPKEGGKYHIHGKIKY